MIPVFIPPSVNISTLYDINGHPHQARTSDDGRIVIDLTPAMFRTLLMGPQGLAWENENQQNKILWERMIPGNYTG